MSAGWRRRVRRVGAGVLQPRQRRRAAVRAARRDRGRATAVDGGLAVRARQLGRPGLPGATGVRVRCSRSSSSGCACAAPRRAAPRWRAGRLAGAAAGGCGRDSWFARAPEATSPSPAPLSPRGPSSSAALCYLAVVVSHQLTPVLLLAGVTGLACSSAGPLWVPAAMVAVEVWWVALAWPYISRHWSLFDRDGGPSAAPAGYELGRGHVRRGVRLRRRAALNRR